MQVADGAPHSSTVVMLRPRSAGRKATTSAVRASKAGQGVAVPALGFRLPSWLSRNLHPGKQGQGKWTTIANAGA